MFVFTRVAGQAVRVGDVFVLVKAIEVDRVDFEIHAPTSMPVHKNEEYEAIRRVAPLQRPESWPADLQE